MFEDIPDVELCVLSPDEDEIVSAPKGRHAVYYKKNRNRRDATRALFTLIDKANSKYGSINTRSAIKGAIFEPAMDALRKNAEKEGYDTKFLEK